VIKTDAVIIGAGPCGLFQVFELGLLGLKAEIIDSIRQPGGQCTELYPDKPIYDIPAVPICSGEELTEALLKQIEPFHCGMHLGEEVTVVRRNDDDSFHVETNAGKQFQAKAVVIAGGVGSFQPRQLRVPKAEEFAGKSLHYRVQDPKRFAGKKLVILGGGDSALDWVLELIDVAEHITLVHRRDEYRAVPASVDKMRQLVADGKMDVIENAKATVIEGNDGVVESIRIQPRKAKRSMSLPTTCWCFSDWRRSSARLQNGASTSIARRSMSTLKNLKPPNRESMQLATSVFIRGRKN